MIYDDDDAHWHTTLRDQIVITEIWPLPFTLCKLETERVIRAAAEAEFGNVPCFQWFALRIYIAPWTSSEKIRQAGVYTRR